MLSIDTWNKLPKDSECESTAIEGDLVEEIGGILFLIQRKNDFNNVVCFRIKDSKETFLSVITKLRKLCIAHGIFYLRVEGTLRRYKFLKTAIKRYSPDGEVNIIQDLDIKNRNVFYIKLV